MTRNQVKIVSDKDTKTLAFYFMNEQQKWCAVSNSSVLSRKEYVTASIKERSSDIVDVINRIYNVGNRGVDIYFEGPVKDFHVLKETLSEEFSNKNIICYIQQSIIAVAGKVQSGKTTLIFGLGGYKGKSYHYTDVDGIATYTDDEGTTIWYEIPGIDIGKENVIAVRESFERLAKKGVTTFIYCLRTSKIEPLEEELIHFVANNYSSVKIILALTQYLDEEQTAFPEQLSEQLDGIRVVPLLAKDLKTREGTISAFGLDKLEHYIFEDS